MVNLSPILFLLAVSTLLPAQSKLVGFSRNNHPYPPASGGMIFTIDADGSNFQVLKDFDLPTADSSVAAAMPLALLKASDGNYYGIGQPSDLIRNAFVFRLNPDGSGFASICTLPEVYSYHKTLIEGSDGWLYGGSLFKLRKDGTGYQKIYSGGYEFTDFLEGVDARIYYRNGFDLMRMEKDGSTIIKLATLHEQQENESSLISRLYSLADGRIFGQFDYLYDDGCNTFFTSSMIFTFNPSTGQLLTQALNSAYWNELALSNDGYLYRPGVRIDPNTLLVSPLDEQCYSSIYDETRAGLVTTAGTWIGFSTSDNDGAHGIIMWDPVSGACNPLINWNSSAPYLGRIAFEISTPTALQQPIPGTSEIRLSPNPVTDLLTVNTTLTLPITWSLLDVTGKPVAKGEIANGVEWQVPTAQFPPGLYFLEIAVEGKIIGGKSMVKI